MIKNGGFSRCRVCYQEGPPCLVPNHIDKNKNTDSATYKVNQPTGRLSDNPGNNMPPTSLFCNSPLGFRGEETKSLVMGRLKKKFLKVKQQFTFQPSPPRPKVNRFNIFSKTFLLIVFFCIIIFTFLFT